jgi:hypothetical protein
MDFLTKPPQWLTEALPQEGRGFLENGGWYAILGIGGLIVLLILWALLRPLFRGRRRKGPRKEPPKLGEDLASYPPLPPSTGDRRLTVEGVPVRLRLVVLAPAGTESEVDADNVSNLLELVLAGLGKVVPHDRPRIRVWPTQLSAEGFARQFHHHTPLPEGEGQPSRWVLVAGRVKAAGQSFMLGLGLQALNPTPLGRRTLQPHDWPTVLRLRVRE